MELTEELINSFETLNLTTNQITDISLFRCLEYNDILTDLDLSYNKIKNISVLKYLKIIVH